MKTVLAVILASSFIVSVSSHALNYQDFNHARHNTPDSSNSQFFYQFIQELYHMYLNYQRRQVVSQATQQTGGQIDQSGQPRVWPVGSTPVDLSGMQTNDAIQTGVQTNQIGQIDDQAYQMQQPGGQIDQSGQHGAWPVGWTPVDLNGNQTNDTIQTGVQKNQIGQIDDQAYQMQQTGGQIDQSGQPGAWPVGWTPVDLSGNQTNQTDVQANKIGQIDDQLYQTQQTGHLTHQVGDQTYVTGQAAGGAESGSQLHQLGQTGGQTYQLDLTGHLTGLNTQVDDTANQTYQTVPVKGQTHQTDPTGGQTYQMEQAGGHTYQFDITVGLTHQGGHNGIATHQTGDQSPSQNGQMGAYTRHTDNTASQTGGQMVNAGFQTSKAEVHTGQTGQNLDRSGDLTLGQTGHIGLQVVSPSGDLTLGQIGHTGSQAIGHPGVLTVRQRSHYGNRAFGHPGDLTLGQTHHTGSQAAHIAGSAPYMVRHYGYQGLRWDSTSQTWRQSGASVWGQTGTQSDPVWSRTGSHSSGPWRAQTGNTSGSQAGTCDLGEYECVPYHLCENPTEIQTGFTCTNPDHVCCDN